MTHGKTYNKSPRRINHKATKSKTNTGTILSILVESHQGNIIFKFDQNWPKVLRVVI